MSCAVLAAVPCSSVPGGDSSGEVWSGCNNAPGYAGSISASTVSPFYSGAFTKAPCPPDKATGFVPDGCTMDAGYSGSVTAATDDPYYDDSNVTAVECPEGSAAPDATSEIPRGTVPAGCATMAGWSGSVTATRDGNFFVDTLVEVNCPLLGSATSGKVPGTSGTGGRSGCTVQAGWAGHVNATTEEPYYEYSLLGPLHRLHTQSCSVTSRHRCLPFCSQAAHTCPTFCCSAVPPRQVQS